MAAMTDGAGARQRVQKVCTLRTHEEAFSREDVLINFDRFQELGVASGGLARIIALRPSTSIRDFENTTNKSRVPEQQGNPSTGESTQTANARDDRGGPTTVTLDENGKRVTDGRVADRHKSYVFVLKDMSAEQKAKHPWLHISLSSTIAAAFGFRSMVPVVLALADEDLHSASHVEITFRDQYLARADMWRLAITELSQKTIYRGQRLLFLGTIKAVVKSVYVNGQSVHSAYFSSNTKTIFRSESARIVLFIQMSREMWDFDTDASGEIMFNKVINGFLPRLFKRWMKLNARHLITIILFTRLEYDRPPSILERTKQSSAMRKPTQDFYRVVVSEWASGDWIYILDQLKKEFKVFLRDVCIMRNASFSAPSPTTTHARTENQPEFLIQGTPTLASKGNILEAINLATSQFARDYIDRDLVRTGISIVVMTPGTGVYEVDYNMLRLTNEILVSSGIAIDLVCLSRMPLHSVPLFKYRAPRMLPPGLHRRSSSVIGEDRSLESTPRQREPNFGNLSSSVSKTALSNASVAGLRSRDRLAEAPAFGLGSDASATDGAPFSLSRIGGHPGDWNFAMPHWVDISFWSGPVEEDVEAPAVIGSKESRFRRHGPKNKRFQIRCRMYELQMMGIMESEMSNISIPYLTSNPFADASVLVRFGNPPADSETAPRSPDFSGLPNPDESYYDQRELSGKAFRGFVRGWMDDYDENAFRPQPLPKAVSHSVVKGDGETHKGQQLKRSELYDSSLYATSFSERNAPCGSVGDQPPSAMLGKKTRVPGKTLEDRSGKDLHARNAPETEQDSQSRRRPPRLAAECPDVDRERHPTDTTRRAFPHQNRPSGHQKTSSDEVNRSKRESVESHNAAEQSANARPGWLARHISFGGLGFGTSKATASTALSSASAGLMVPKKESPSGGSVTGQNALEHVRASLSRNASQYSSHSTSAPGQDGEAPTQPIAIKRTSRPHDGDGVSSQAAIRGSEETLPVEEEVDRAKRSHDYSPGGPVLYSAHRGQDAKPKVDLSSSGGARVIPRTLSPTSALSPWMVLVNPCNPKKNDMNVSKRFRRWQHVYPKLPKTSAIKWKSLCSPASVPLTNDYFPTAHQLADEYEENPYKVSPIEDYESEEPKSREDFVRELIGFRLSHGFQVVVGAAVSEYVGVQESDLADVFDKDYVAHDGATVFMALGNTIHQLVCQPHGEVEVKRFKRKSTTATFGAATGAGSVRTYQPMIRTQFSNEYERRDVLMRPPREEYNWNNIDNFIAGYQEEFSDVLRFWRARFVLIPVDLPVHTRRPLPVLTEDSEEEIRLEGIRKLTQLWQRHRYLSPDERHFQATRKRKDTNPLAIEYQTRDPSAIVAAGPDVALLADTEPSAITTQIFSESEPYHTSNIDLQKLAQDLQGEKGIHVMDRRWHWRLHYKCFVGFDLVGWLLQNFSDIETRDEAVELGRQLMEQGLFQHVHKKHLFRDGNFFYQIASEYRAPRTDSRTSWFGRRSDKSVPSTPMTARRSSRPNTQSSVDSGEKTPVGASTPRRKVTLSYALRYDVDQRKRSYRPEIINLHYDRLHNPDNCYHIRIDWMNVTAKLIEDAIVTWATMIERFGLKLVELPVAEAASITETHPFRAPYVVTLAVEPPDSDPPAQYFDTTSFDPQRWSDKFIYHKALLRKLDFVLDLESASSFPAEVDVSYSWGRPDYRYTQYIHRSGVVIAQITDEGKFLLLANRLYNNRAAASRDAGKFDRMDNHDRRPAFGVQGSGPAGGGGKHSTVGNAERLSPFSSPLVRAMPETILSVPAAPPLAGHPKPQLSAAQIKDLVESFCHDADALRAFYDETLLRPQVDPSPQTLGPVVDTGSIPSLGLPPSITVRTPEEGRA